MSTFLVSEKGKHGAPRQTSSQWVAGGWSSRKSEWGNSYLQRKWMSEGITSRPSPGRTSCTARWASRALPSLFEKVSPGVITNSEWQFRHSERRQVMANRKLLLAVCAAVFALVFVSGTVATADAHKTTYLTF